MTEPSGGLIRPTFAIFMPNAVPEPSAWHLGGPGLVGILPLVRRRRPGAQ